MTRIVQISDFHYTHLTWNPLRLLSKRFFGMLNWIFRRKSNYSVDQLKPLHQLFKELKVDLLLLGGDFTTTALKEEFMQAASWVHSLGIPWIAIPGNHDNYTFRSERDRRFYQYFQNHPYQGSLAKEGLELHKINSYWLIAMDTTQATCITSSEGMFSPILEKKLTILLSSLPTQDPVILFTHYPFFQNDLKTRSLSRGEHLETLLRKFPQVRLYLHGHTHRHILANLQASNLPLILDSGSATHTEFGSWNLIDLLPTGCAVTPYFWSQTWQPKATISIPWNFSQNP